MGAGGVAAFEKKTKKQEETLRGGTNAGKCVFHWDAKSSANDIVN